MDGQIVEPLFVRLQYGSGLSVVIVAFASCGVIAQSPLAIVD
jgi:hypothetical protein